MLGSDDVPRRPDAFERQQQPPAKIDLPRLQPQPSRSRVRVVVVVPALAEADQARERDIVPLHRRALDDPRLPALAVGEVADQPMSGNADGDAHCDTPHQPRPAAQHEKQKRPRKLLHHPMAFEPRVEAIVRDAVFQNEGGWAIEHEVAVELVPGVAPEAATVAEVAVARGLALCPVAQIVNAHHPDRSRHADEHAQIDEEMFEPERTGEAAVDQPPVQAERVARAECDGGGEDKQRERARGEGERPGDKRRGGHRANPKGLRRCPADASRDWIGGIANDAFGAGDELHRAYLPSPASRSRSLELSRLSGADTGQTFCTKPFSVFTRFSRTSE